MSDDKFIVFAVEDILAIRIQCRCGSAVVIRPADWQALPSCPAYHAERTDPDTVPERAAANQLGKSLRLLLEEAKHAKTTSAEPRLQVRLEIKDPNRFSFS
jgi:hypothetical protein